MEFHDSYLRTTPAEILVAEGEDVTERFESIARERETSGVPEQDPLRFQTLLEVGRLLDGLLPDDAPPEAAHVYGVLAYYCFQSWRAGRGSILMTQPLARHLCAFDTVIDPPTRAPAFAGYLQLPRNLFWVRSEQDANAEPVDGLLWEVRGEEVGAVLVSGVRDDRPGLGIMVASPIPWSLFADSVHTQIRTDAADFQSTLPGGDEARLFSVETNGELYKLLGRTFSWLEGHPEEMSPLESAPEEGVPRPSSFSFHRLDRTDAT